jgi:lipopolysaccharide export system permease protein
LKINSYIAGRTLVGMASALAAVSSIIVLVDMVELSRSLGGRGEISFARILELTILEAPSVVLVLLPFVVMFGVMGAFITLNRGGELIAMRSAGLSAWRFITPAAVAAFVVGLLSIGLLNPLAALANAHFEDLRANLINGGSGGSTGEIWLRQGDAFSQMVIHANSRDSVDGAIRLKGVSIFIESVGQTGVLDSSRRIEADEALLLPGYWRLTGVREARAGSESVRSEALSLPSSLDRRSAMEKFVSAAAVAVWDLPRTIKSAELAGYSSAAYRLRLQQLLAMPLLLVAMTALAAAFSLRLPRLGDLAILAGAGVSLGLLTFFLNQFCAALAVTDVIPVWIAAWTPPALALLSACTFICYTEDG